jgi:DNA-binding transcriptional MerR regulator
MAKPTTQATTFPLLSAKEMSDLCGFTPHRLRQLEREGFFGKKGRDRYNPVEVFQGYVRFLQDDSRRTSKSASASRAQDARAREIEQRIAKEDGRLIPIEDVAAGVTEIMGALRAELTGVAAASTRDLALREVIDGHLNGAIDRTRQRFEAMQGDIRTGRGVVLDGEDADAG